MEERKVNKDKVNKEKRDISQGIPLFAIKVMVVAYLFWIIQEIIFGIIDGNIVGEFRGIFGIVCIILLLATVGLFIPEIREHKKTKKVTGDRSEA